MTSKCYTTTLYNFINYKEARTARFTIDEFNHEDKYFLKILAEGVGWFSKQVSGHI